MISLILAVGVCYAMGIPLLWGLMVVPVQQQVMLASVSLSGGRGSRRRFPLVCINCVAETLNVEATDLAFESRLPRSMGD